MCNVCCTDQGSSFHRWYIPLAGYNSDGSGTVRPLPPSPTSTKTTTPTHSADAQRESSSSMGLYAAFPYYELSVEVTVPEQSPPQQAVNIPAVNIPAVNIPATGGPGIDGSLRAGETLTASTSGIADEDGHVGGGLCLPSGSAMTWRRPPTRT